jgi:DNA repair exonuclease SbcCD ATPase subunit
MKHGTCCDTEMTDEGVMCDFCEVSHPSDYDCDENILANMILDLDRKVNNQWEMNYKSIENLSKRLSKVEDDIISLYRKIEFYENSIQRKWQANTELSQRLTSLEEQTSYKQIIDDIIGEIGKLKSTKAQADLVADHYIKTEKRLDKCVDIELIYTMRQTIETWQKGCEVQLNVLMKCNKELENQVDACNEQNKKLTHNLDILLNHQKKIDQPYKCPVCEGRRNITSEMPNGAYFDFPCKSCEGKGIVWG